MSGQFTLYCEYLHCCGKQVLELGTAEDESTARQWVHSHTQNKKRPRLSEDDLIRTCPVTHCPAKRQYPRFDYRPAVS